MPSLLRLGSSCAVLLTALGRAAAASAAAAAHASSAGAVEGTPPSSSDDGKKNEAHLSELFYTSAQVGVQYVGLEQLHLTKELFPSTVRTVDVGPEFGVAAGIRLVFVTLGARFQYGAFRDWDLWSLGAETALRVPLGSLEPYLMLGAGYARLGRVQSSSMRVHAQGYNVRLGLGADYYFTHMFSLGAGLSGELIGLTRPGVDLNRSTGSVNQDVYQLDGSALGIALTGALAVGFHL